VPHECRLAGEFWGPARFSRQLSIPALSVGAAIRSFARSLITLLEGRRIERYNRPVTAKKALIVEAYPMLPNPMRDFQ
jgi:hypothetical protein